ncbi:GTP-binding protein Rheb-like protein [Larimichthys crocea]|uniref:Uncharacterized protein n=1 Tax=Larimichthys crocea TaxID=215358 RepID=A0ACD3R910_LARCR|nr:GTP-binding protein Rheb-like protein [Larimichthys crocea]
MPLPWSTPWMTLNPLRRSRVCERRSSEVKEDKYTPIVVIGNKIDRHNERRVSSDDVLSTVELDWNNSFLESSAKDNVNVLEAFRELLQQANLPSWLSPALCRRRETFPKKSNQRPPMNKTNSCLIS